MYEAIERCIDNCDAYTFSDYAKVELTHARNALVLLEKVARERHDVRALNEYANCQACGFTRCPDALCKSVREAIYGESKLVKGANK